MKKSNDAANAGLLLFLFGFYDFFRILWDY